MNLNEFIIFCLLSVVQYYSLNEPFHKIYELIDWLIDWLDTG